MTLDSHIYVAGRIVTIDRARELWALWRNERTQAIADGRSYAGWDSVLVELKGAVAAWQRGEKATDRAFAAQDLYAINLFQGTTEAADEAEHRLWMQTECGPVYDEGRGELF